MKTKKTKKTKKRESKVAQAIRKALYKNLTEKEQKFCDNKLEIIS